MPVRATGVTEEGSANGTQVALYTEYSRHPLWIVFKTLGGIPRQSPDRLGPQWRRSSPDSRSTCDSWMCLQRDEDDVHIDEARPMVQLPLTGGPRRACVLSQEHSVIWKLTCRQLMVTASTLATITTIITVTIITTAPPPRTPRTAAPTGCLMQLTLHTDSETLDEYPYRSEYVEFSLVSLVLMVVLLILTAST
ncbi:hypothetical protein KGM_213640 [Danaus plexippus plexippus]|uniref:Uncharacterized protein n=1 Tax=Danaus plexippus plexippus TaxID=278856 RepID=A0A212ES91_DANPL|nr:hypothetical protein KGM_213640 [Danaus plexippus plexippus]